MRRKNTGPLRPILSPWPHWPSKRHIVRSSTAMPAPRYIGKPRTYYAKEAFVEALPYKPSGVRISERGYVRDMYIDGAYELSRLRKQRRAALKIDEEQERRLLLKKKSLKAAREELRSIYYSRRTFTSEEGRALRRRIDDANREIEKINRKIRRWGEKAGLTQADILDEEALDRMLRFPTDEILEKMTQGVFDPSVFEFPEMRKRNYAPACPHDRVIYIPEQRGLVEYCDVCGLELGVVREEDLMLEGDPDPEDW